MRIVLIISKTLMKECISSNILYYSVEHQKTWIAEEKKNEKME